jgi:hypothetical protein
MVVVVAAWMFSFEVNASVMTLPIFASVFAGVAVSSDETVTALIHGAVLSNTTFAAGPVCVTRFACVIVVVDSPRLPLNPILYCSAPSVHELADVVAYVQVAPLELVIEVEPILNRLICGVVVAAVVPLKIIVNVTVCPNFANVVEALLETIVVEAVSVAADAGRGISANTEPSTTTKAAARKRFLLISEICMNRI